MQTAAYWVDKLKLQPHPEGGYYSETYRSADFTRCLPDRFPDGQDRRFSTAIYFLLEEGEGRCSHFHRIKSDELWHFYAGSSLTVHIIDDTGKYSAIKVGPDFDKGQVFQAVVHEGCWFGATVDEPNCWALVGCTVSPGFDFVDFELAKYEDLVKLCPEQAELIKRMT